MGGKKVNGRLRAGRKLFETGLLTAALALVMLAMPLAGSSPLLENLAKGLRPVALLLGALSSGLLLAGWWLKRAAQQPPPSLESPRPIRPNSTPRPAPVQPARPELAMAPAAPGEPLTPDAPGVLPQAWSAAVFERIEWRRFEAVVERLFQQAGFETQSQSHGADEGVDIWLYSRHQPGAAVSLVQCKHWQGKRVGVDKIRELRGVMAARDVKRGQFATTSSFTPDATAFARDNGINLLDQQRLLDLIAQRTPAQQAELLALAFEGDYWRPTCASCGGKMLARQPRKGGAAFWGCEAYPRCRGTLPMRQA